MSEKFRRKKRWYPVPKIRTIKKKQKNIKRNIRIHLVEEKRLNKHYMLFLLIIK